ncbi:helix-turn-helix domain-containing protein [Jingyaoa shaoxingensis]|uniref:Helix-turn-helix transcriptional regulator n=1 Tax=Jingyaoa shaoxingensis TaxID=2763671 RepID=A0ABR7NB71_9FIRM|nr:helix-turn-helix transcriptional regulator [Jingyaoa shaoxingensis]MBC8573645.1 helix-turn-helix transcriptional regulator [Jingyaoa shaoxingensis]
MISYQKLFDKLREEGWSFYRVRQEKLIGQGTLTRLRNQSGGLDSKTLNKICRTFNCQPGDLMEYIPDEGSESDSE